MSWRRGGPTLAQEEAVLHTVVYASLFEYPLTLSQLRDSLIGVEADEEAIAAWHRASMTLQGAIDCRDGWYVLRGRGDLVATRAEREARSRLALDTLATPLRLVLAMPFVRMVALSGSLAHLNAAEEPDLDLFVITSPGRVWSVVTTVLVIARVFGWRRRLCLNYVVSEKAMAVAPPDLFAANQIIHLIPIAGDAVYRRFLEANPFVREIYPNFAPREGAGSAGGAGRGLRGLAGRAFSSGIEWLLSCTIAPLYEQLCRAAYGWHLRRRAATWQSADQVRLEAECLKLHTSSHRADVMARFERAMAEARQQARLPIAL